MNLDYKKQVEIKNKNYYYDQLIKNATDKVKAKYEKKRSRVLKKIEEKYKRVSKGKPARKEKEITIAKLMTEIQLYVRLRDSDADGMGYCISCNKPIHYKHGDGGHYISRTYKALIMDLDNIHLQCKGCNKKMSMRGKEGDTVTQHYRENLIKKVAKHKVLGLEKEAERTKGQAISINKGLIKEEYEKYRKLNKELESKKIPLLV